MTRDDEAMSAGAATGAAPGRQSSVGDASPDLPSIRSRVEGATPGPWTLDADRCVRAPNGLIMADWQCADDAGAEADCSFIAHARTDIPALLLALQQVIGERDELKNAMWSLLTAREAHLAAEHGCQSPAIVTALEREMTEAHEQARTILLAGTKKAPAVSSEGQVVG